MRISGLEAPAGPTKDLSFLDGQGEMAARMRAFDWASTPLGPPESWPQSLKTAVRIVLTSRFAMWMLWGPDLTFFCNDAYAPTLGVKRDWALGARSDVVWAEIWRDIGPRIDKVLTTGEATWDDELRLYLERSGFREESFHTFSYSPLSDDAGAIAGMLCVVTEVTERVIGERQLATLRDLGARLTEAATREQVTNGFKDCLKADPRDLPFALIYLTDPSGGRAALNACYGLPEHHPAAPPVIEIGAPASAWPLAEALEGILEEAAPGGLPAPENGHWEAPPERALVVAIGAKAGAAIGFLVAGLSPHRRLDEGYRGFIELITGQIAAALARADEYERARERADALAEIDRAKTAFFSNVSHEFRTPLTLMLGPIEEAMADGSAPEALRPLLDAAHRNALRLLRLVNALLDFTRVEAGRAEALYEPTDLSLFTADLASSFESLCEQAGLQLEVICARAPEAVFVDRSMWEKVVLNLLSNAFKFTFEGSITVELFYDDHEARLEVRDTGVGIPAEALPRLFDRFHRVEGQRGRSFEGSGIGLALVQELVELHGGSITVESEVGRGSSFKVALPLGNAHLAPERVRPDPPAATPAGAAKAFVEEALRWIPGTSAAAAPCDSIEAAGARPRILLADDNADMREYVRRLLSPQYEVESVADGLAALQAARVRRPDLILTDVMMPGLDGFGLLAAVRGEEGLRDVPVVMLSARAGEEAQVEGLEAGADDYLSKPFTARELTARVAANLKLAAEHRRAEEALHTLNAALEQRVEEEMAARAKAEEALRQAQKMEAVGQLTGGVAHDFNNLLTVIIGGLDTIRRAHPEETARIRRALDMSLQGAQRAANLTQRLLAFSRRQPLAPKALDLNHLVRDMTDLLHRTLGEQIELEGVLAPRLWTVEADQNQLESAIINLAVNARDAMPDGGKLTIETANTALDEGYSARNAEVAAGQYVMVAISDTGTGMSRETVEHAFEPFFTTKEVGRGTGLGLSMVYGFVKQSGGHVTIYSEPGEGTTVKLYFPRFIGAVDRHAVEAEAPVPLGSEGETVLVVEDNGEVRSYSAAILSELGYAVIEAEDADAALAVLASERRVDLLFTDVVLPGKNGRMLADAAGKVRPGLKVLFTTGYSRNAIVHHGRLDPGVQLISKPFTYEQLATRIRDLLDKPATG